MKVVIDIGEADYDLLMKGEVVKKYLTKDYILATLPEGHGRIGDLDQILIWLIYKKGIIDELKCGEIAPVFKDATIIEAENEAEDLVNLDSMLEDLWNATESEVEE